MQLGIKKSILIVDDDKDILTFLSYNLRKEGYRIFTATDGEEAIAQVKKIQPSFILLDVMMPVLDGIEACRLIRSMRLNEQLTLKWDQVDLKNMMITILAEHTKTGIERKIPLTPRAIQILQKLPRHIKGRVFPVSLNNFQRAWRSITRNAEIENLHWHDLRREACSRLMESGLSISEVQMFTGHKTLSLMLKTYSQHNPSVVAKKLNSVQ